MQLAVREHRIVLTHDLDFGRLLALSGDTQPSLITFRLSDMTPASVMRRLAEAIRLFPVELEHGAALSVTDSATRCHPLPINPG